MGKVLSVVAGAALSAFTGPAGFSITGFLLSTASSLALSAIQRALAPKPKTPSSNFAISAGRSSITQNVRQPITSHQIVYGEKRVSGPIVFVSSTNGNNYLHLVVVLAAHEVEAINEVWFNDTVIGNDFIDVNGNVIMGRYTGLARIKKYLGTASQGADPNLVAECPEWTVDHRLQGRAYIYVRLICSQDIFPGGIPNISAVVKGKKILDPRDNEEKFTTNSALIAYDFMMNQKYGLESIGAIDIDSVIAAANICDEFVETSAISETVMVAAPTSDLVQLETTRLRFQLGDRVTFSSTGTVPGGLDGVYAPYYVDDAETDLLYSDDAETDQYYYSETTGTPLNYYVIPYQYKDSTRIRLAATLADALANNYIDITSAGSGVITVTKNAEPRYHGAGALTTNAEVGDNFLDILSGFGGKAIYAGGIWKILAAAYTAPTFTLSENDITAPMKIATQVARREKFNQIKGVFSSSINDWQPTDYPAMTDDAAVTRDGQLIPRDYDLPFTNREFTTQRLAKIEVLKAGQPIIVKCRCTLRAMQVQAGDTIYVNNERMGWEEKIFEVTQFKFILGGSSKENPELGVELTLRETAADIYDWDTSEESDIDIAPNSNLPNAFDVAAVTGVAFSSRPVETAGGDTVYALVLQWTISPDAFVVNDGRYEIQFKLSSEDAWRPSFYVSGEITFTDVQQASVNTSYDLRIRAINNLGVRSSWVTIFGATVGTSGGVGSTDDWGLFSDSVTTSDDWGLFSDSVTTSDDWGFFT